MKNKQKLNNINDFIKGTMVSALGIKITDIGNDYVSGEMPVNKYTKQPWGFLHGGASVALAETLGSIAGHNHVLKNNETVVGIEINANHLKAINKGWVYGTAKPIKISKNFHVWSIQIKNKDGALICISRLTLAVIKK